MAAGSAGEGAGSNTELRWTFSRLACQSEMELASELDIPTLRRGIGGRGVVHDAVQQAVMQYGYDDELFQDWRDGKIGEKDLPEEVMAMTLDLCERWRAEQERCRRVHAAQRLSRDPGPSRSRSRSRSPNSCRSSVSGCDEG